MSEIIQFKGLNELRAVAAFAVIFHHIELYKSKLSKPSLFTNNHLNYFIEHLGKNAVFLFFVLSGFLITFLLLKEKNDTGKINVSKFYGRRIVRIWPLYFIILIIGFFILPYVYHWFPTFFEGQDFYNKRIENLNYGYNLILFLFFFSNVALGIFGGVAGAAQTWSVSVEEQFYFVWPWIVKFFNKNLVVVLIVIIVLINLIKYKISYFNSYPFLKYFFSSFHVDFMAFGGIMAIVYRDFKTKIHSLVTNKFFIFLTFFAIGCHLFFSISQLTLAVLFSILIVILIINNYENKLFSTFGKWSYGIYMYHPVVMYFSFSALNKFSIESILLDNFLIYIFVFGGTILISYLSYNFIENYFLKFKKYFSPYKDSKA